MTEPVLLDKQKRITALIVLGLFVLVVLAAGLSDSGSNSNVTSDVPDTKTSGFLSQWNLDIQNEGLNDIKRLSWQQNKFTKVVDSVLPKELSQENITDYGSDGVQLSWSLFKIPDEQKPNFLLNTYYSGTNWVFGDSIFIRFGEESRSFVPENAPYQNVITGGVFESMSFIFSEDDLNFLSKVFQTDEKDFQILITSSSSMGGMRLCQPNQKEISSLKLLLNSYRYLLKTNQLNLSFIDVKP